MSFSNKFLNLSTMLVCKNMLKETFYILKYLYQQNAADRAEEDAKFEEDCYNSDEFDYLI